MADEFICINYFVTELTAVLEPGDTRLPIPEEFAKLLCEMLGVDPCAGCIPGVDDPPTTTGDYTRLMIHHNGRFEIVKATGCEAGVPIIERGEEDTDPLKFPVGACVQFVWTCANAYDNAVQAAGVATANGLSFDPATNILTYDAAGTPSVDLSTMVGNTFVNSMSYDKASNMMTLGLTNGSTISSQVSPYVTSSSYDVGTEVLSITLSDGTLFTTTIPQPAAGTDIYLASATYDNGTRIMTLTMSDATSYAVNLGGLYGLNLSNVVFNTVSNVLTFTMSDASTFTADLTDLEKHVSSAVYSNITKRLTLNYSTGGSIDADLTDLAEDTKVNSFNYDPVSHELEIGSSDGSTVSADIELNDTFVNGMAFDVPTRTLTLTNSDGTFFNVVIP